MSKIILTTIFVSFMSLLYSQYKYELPYYDYNDLRYSTFFEFGKLDTNEFGEDYINKYLSNGREIEKRFIGDSLWYDSINRFHENGSLAFREVSLSYANYCKEYKNDYECMRPNSRIETFYDNGIIGVGGDCFACLVKDQIEGNKIIELLNSNLYKFYIETNKWSGFHNKEVLQDLPNIINEIENINDENIYKYFEIIEEEIKIIEESI